MPYAPGQTQDRGLRERGIYGAAWRNRSDRWATTVTGFAVSLGLALRIRQYASNRSLWLDETKIGNLIIHTDLWGLLAHPLGTDQAAPVGWLLLEKVTVDVLGTSELALRLWPLLSSVAMMLLTPAVARRLMSGWPTAVATALVVVSPQLIYYGSEVKPYGSDGTATLMILYLLTSNRSWETLKGGLLAGIGIAAMCWYSFPGVFVSVAGLLVLLVLRWRSNRPLVPLLAGGAFVALNVIVDYLVDLRHLGNNNVLHTYWHDEGGFPPAHDDLSKFIKWLVHQPANVIHFPGQLALAPLALALVIVGAGFVARNASARSPLTLVLVALIAGLAVAAISKYPLAIRVALWSIPIGLILLAAVLEGPAVIAIILSGLLVVVAGSSMVRGVDAFATPLRNDDARGAYSFVAQHRAPGDLLLSDLWAGPTLAYYSPRYHLAESAVFGLKRGPTCQIPGFLTASAGKRMWIVFAHHASGAPADSNALYLDYFRQFGTLTESWNGYGRVGAFLFILNGKRPAIIHQSQWWEPRHECLSITSP